MFFRALETLLSYFVENVFFFGRGRLLFFPCLAKTSVMVVLKRVMVVRVLVCTVVFVQTARWLEAFPCPNPCPLPLRRCRCIFGVFGVGRVGKKKRHIFFGGNVFVWLWSNSHCVVRMDWCGAKQVFFWQRLRIALVQQSLCSMDRCGAKAMFFLCNVFV